VFGHVTIRVSDREASERFYDAVLSVLGKPRAGDEDDTQCDDFSIVCDGPPTWHLHVGFYAPGHELVDAFHRAGVEAGYESDGGPGERPVYHPGYYGAFVLDPDGHNIEAVNP
jgi:catechol 2,3-dioxygenase-like lactoylglutathione lyase family enzyme